MVPICQVISWSTTQRLFTFCIKSHFAHMHHLYNFYANYKSWEREVRTIKKFRLGVIDTQNFSPYSWDYFVEHCSVFLYILHEVSFCSNKTSLCLLGLKMANVWKSIPGSVVANTQNFGPYSPGHFVQHCSHFVYILHEASCSSNRTLLYRLCTRIANVQER